MKINVFKEDFLNYLSNKVICCCKVNRRRLFVDDNYVYIINWGELKYEQLYQ